MTDEQKKLGGTSRVRADARRWRSRTNPTTIKKLNNKNPLIFI